MSLRVEALNFRSFSAFSWELPDGLTLIDGENRDAGGSNMSGKTTLFDAWFWARYGWLPKWGGPKGGSVDAVIKRGEKSCSVKVTEKFGPDEISYRRERPNRFTVWKNGVEQKGMDQKQFETLIGMSDMRFLICVYIPQKRKQSFYHMGDKERTEMLSVIAGLEELDEAHADAKVRKDNAKQKIERLEGSKTVYETQLLDFPVKKKVYEDQRDDAERGLLDAEKILQEKEKARDGAIPVLNEEKNRNISESTRDEVLRLLSIDHDIQNDSASFRELETELNSVPVVEPELLSRISLAKLRLSNGKQVNERIQATIKANQKLKEKAEREEHLAESALHGKCQTCTQPLPDWDINAKVTKHRDSARELLSSVVKEPESLDLGVIEKELEEANTAYIKRKAELDGKPNEIRLQMQAVDSKIKETLSEKKRIEGEIRAIEKRFEQEEKNALFGFQRDCAAAKSDVRLARANFENALKGLAGIEGEERKIRRDKANAEVALDLEHEELSLSLDLIDLCGPKGYRAVCFDGLVNRIGDRAGELLQLMTDGLYNTRLEQIGTDSKGNQKLILKPVVMKGSQEVPADDLSGGAEDRIALAFDVAVSDAAGDGLPLLLDEVLKGIDEVGKAEAMVLLEEVSKTRPVLVIDHTSEFKAMFSQVVKVVYENEESKIDAAGLDGAAYNQLNG